jgi:hypothetical protein
MAEARNGSGLMITHSKLIYSGRKKKMATARM